MKKGQTSVRNSIEDLLHPVTDMYITQGSNGGYSHQGIMANDIRGKNAGVKYAYYAPCTCKCKKIYPDSGQSMWQSTSKVRFADGRVDYFTFMIAHDDTQDCKVGQIVKQGLQLGNMGLKGLSTGVHLHLQTSAGTSTKWYKNKYGNYQFDNEVDLDSCFFMDGTNILNGMGGSWKYLKDVPVEEPKTEPPTEAPTEPKVDEDKEKIKQLEEQVTQLKKEVDTLNKNLKKANDDYEQKVVEYDSLNQQLTYMTEKYDSISKENEELKEGLPTLIFTSPKTDYYAIRLEEKQRLYII